MSFICHSNSLLFLSSLLLAAARGHTHSSGGSSSSSNPLKPQDRQTNNGYSLGSSAGFLLADTGELPLNRSNQVDAKLDNLLGRVGPDMRPTRGFHDFSDISPQVAQRAWRLMRNHASQVVAERIAQLRPFVQRALAAANVSTQCASAADKTMDAAQRMHSWAIQLSTAWGSFPPTGIYEGTFGDIGSYHGCVNVPQNEAIGHAHYCTLSYRPVMPSRRSCELIVRQEPSEMLSLFDYSNDEEETIGSLPVVRGKQANNATNEDAFTDLLAHAQYSHYVYYKLGTCFPIQCNPRDVQRLAKMLGRRSVLMSGPVKCHSKYEQDYEQPVFGQRQSAGTVSGGGSGRLQISTKDLNDGVYIWKPHTTQAQRVSLLIVGSVTLLILLLTLVDIGLNRAPKLFAKLNGPLLTGVDYVLAYDQPIKPTAQSAKHEFTKLDFMTSVREEKEGMKIEEENGVNNNNNTITSRTDLSELNKDTRPVHSGDFMEDQGDVGQKKSIIDHDSSSMKAPPNGARAARTILEVPEQRLSHQHQQHQHRQLELEQQQQQKEEKKQHFGVNQHKALKPVASPPAALLARRGRMNGLAGRKSLLVELVDDFSIITNAREFGQVSAGQARDDILCLNGIRCITMGWIIITHTMQYNDWSAFARTREIESHLKSLINQPLFNASYLVDTFFLISGLLTSFSSFRVRGEEPAGAKTKADQEKRAKELAKFNGNEFGSILAKFSTRSYLIGRYLRLTPQIVFVSLLFILLPLLSKTGGPHWYTVTGEFAENCSKNWWINMLHIQAFYRSDEMCNIVSWWISVDMFFHLFGLAIILLILHKGHHLASISCASLVIAHGIIQTVRHYQLALPPNLLSTIPQTGAMWSTMTLDFFWTPQAHGFPFYLGFYLGYLMAQRKSSLSAWFTFRRASLGWTLAMSLLVLQSYSTYFWVIGHWHYTRAISTIFYLICPMVWSACLCWIILACHFGYGGFINGLLSCKLFIILGRASYIVYLSHFLVLFTYFGGQNLLVEPTQMVMVYVVIGNICVSMLFGSVLYIVYESPWLKCQRRLMKLLPS